MFPNKKALGVAQVFIFILAAVVFSMIMIFGYKAINSFLDSGQKVQMVEFKTQLENEVKKIYTEYGSFRIKNFRIPGEYQQICFVDMDYPVDKISEEKEELCSLDVHACSVWEQAAEAQSESTEANYQDGYESVDQNVFLSPFDENTPKIKVYRISLLDQEQSKGFLCLKLTSNSFSLALEGKGDHTEISLPSRD